MKKSKGENVEENKMNIDIYVDMLEELVENNRNTIESSEEHETEEVNLHLKKFITEYIFLEDNVLQLIEKLQNNDQNTEFIKSVLEGKFSSLSSNYRACWSSKLQTIYNKRKKFMDENAPNLTNNDVNEITDNNESQIETEKVKFIPLDENLKKNESYTRKNLEVSKTKSQIQRDYSLPEENNSLKKCENGPESANANPVDNKDDKKSRDCCCVLF